MRCAQCGNEAPGGARFCVKCGAQMTDPEADTIVPEEESESDLLLHNVRRELASDYQIERELGRGGMAIVYEAIDIQLGRRVALKVLPPEMALRRSMADRFKREAKMAAALDHPNIVPVYRVGHARGLLYIAMKYIRGRALDDIVAAQGALPVPVVVSVLRGAASALAYAHERGIVHRDVKSANIMIDMEGRAVVSDFGIARTVEEPQLTATGAVVGTPYFMSPEQCAARRIGPQSDQYSLGVVAFQMLTGTVPFSADTLPGIMHHHFYTPVPDMRVARPEIPPELLDVIDRLLAKKSEERYGSTQALADAVAAIPLGEPDRRDAERILRELAGGAPVARVSVSTLPPLQTSIRLTPVTAPAITATIRRRLSTPLGAAAGASGLVVLVTAGWLLASRVGATTPAETTVPSAAADADVPPSEPSDSNPSSGIDRPSRDVPPAARGVASTQPVARVVATSSEPSASDPSATSPRRNGEPISEPARPVAPPKAVPAAAPGKLRVRSEPSTAEIFVDDTLLNQGVVMDVLIPAGKRRLRITAAGFEPYEAEIEIMSGETINLSTIRLTPRGAER